MPLILPGNVGSATAATSYSVANSARFDNAGDDSLTRSKGSETSLRKGTFSWWMKRAENEGTAMIVYSNETTSDSNRAYIEVDANENFRVISSEGADTQILLVTDAEFRDFSAWTNFVVSVDTTQGTAANRVKIYINGVLETSFSTSTYPGQNADLILFKGGQTNKEHIGKLNGVSPKLSAYLSEFVFVDGLQLAADQFGEFDSDSGIWRPIDVSGLTFGNEGFYLNFQTSAELGDDVSGNTNDFSETNLIATNQSTDTCTNNFATWNPLWSQTDGNVGDVIFSEGNLKTTTSANYRTYPTTIGFSSGKWYWEIRRYEDDGSNDMHTGVMSELATPANTATWIGNAANGWVFATDAGSTYTGGTESNTGYSSAGSAGDIVQVAFDADNGKIYFGVNGTWQGSADPAAGTNYAYSSLDTSLFYFPCASTGSDVEANFGSPSYSISSGNADGNGYGNFEYAVPSGYYSLNTKNLAEYG